MFINIKALIVVLALAWPVWALAKPICLRFTAPEDFARRRGVWFVVTIIAFLSPSLWFYLLLAGPLIAWAGRKDSNPLALYLLLLFVAPPFEIRIPTVLIGELFAVTHPRVLGFLILLPAVLARFSGPAAPASARWNAFDTLLIAYALLQLVLFIPYETPTNTMRRGFLYLLDTYLVFFAFSRLLNSRQELADVMGALCLSAAIAAPMAIFESMRGWLLYAGIPEMWGNPNIFGWLFRSGSLRAQVNAGHSITLGYIFSIAMGFWMFLKVFQSSKKVNFAFFILLTGGLLVTYARGPWLMAVLTVVVAFVLGTRNAVEMMKVALVPVLVMIALVASPFASQFVDLLPFVGTAAQDSIDQRQQLAETSWRLIQENPWFGNPFVLLQMEDLRTGDGIIDLVNGYVQVALFYGLVGLALFLAVYVLALVKSYVTFRRAIVSGDAEMVWLGASLIACMVGSLFMMAAGGQLWLQWVSAAILVAYARLQVTAITAPERVAGISHVMRPKRAAAL
jgi:O-antigen ligase